MSMGVFCRSPKVNVFMLIFDRREKKKDRDTGQLQDVLAFDNFNIIPPGAGIVHQVNLEFLAEATGAGGEEHGVLKCRSEQGLAQWLIRKPIRKLVRTHVRIARSHSSRRSSS